MAGKREPHAVDGTSAPHSSAPSQAYHSQMSKSESNTIPAINVPTGGQLLGFADLKMQSTECSAATNLQTQVAPLIAALSCQFKVLRLLKPLIGIIRALPNPPVQALREFSKAADDLAPCLLVPTPPGVLPFLRDLLCLEIRSLKCLLRNLQAITAMAGDKPGAVAASEVRSVLDSYPPIVGILNLASGLFQIAGLAIPKAPTLGGGIDPASLAVDQSMVETFTATLQTMADELGGCQ